MWSWSDNTQNNRNQTVKVKASDIFNAHGRVAIFFSYRKIGSCQRGSNLRLQLGSPALYHWATPTLLYDIEKKREKILFFQNWLLFWVLIVLVPGQQDFFHWSPRKHQVQARYVRWEFFYFTSWGYRSMLDKLVSQNKPIKQRYRM